MLFFFFKQKTAYEMRISDWSSDVCSSDLLSGQRDFSVAVFSAGQPELGASSLVGYCVGVLPLRLAIDAAAPVGDLLASTQQIVAQGMAQIGRASCRERVCQ